MKLNKLILIALIALITSCSSDDDEQYLSNNTLGYTEGMSYLDCEYVTGQHLEDGLFRVHYSGESDKYSLPKYYYEESNDEDVDSKGFYASLTFNFYGEKLVSIDIEFNHYGTIASNESPRLYSSERDEVMQEVVAYFKNEGIDASFEFTSYEDNSISIEDGLSQIVGVINL